MSEFVNVPVPAHLVLEVMRFIAEREGGDHPTSPTGVHGWTRADLKVIADHRADMPSVDLFARVLTHLAEVAPTRVARDDIAAALGEDGVTMVKRFGAVTRFINKRIPDRTDTWPIVWGDGLWGMDEETAALWLAVVEDAEDGRG